MKKIITLALAALVTTTYAQPSKARIDSLMSFYDTAYGFNGVALVSYKGELLLDKGYGYRNIEKKIKNDPSTIFQMGSNTKQFTAEVILMLEKEGKLSVGDKLSKYFQDYPNGDKIKLENLLTHTSGIYNYTDDTSWQKDLEKGISQSQMIALFRDRPLLFTPGEKFEYSNSNYILLGYIIEQVTKEKYEQVVHERILTPLGMSHSGFDYTHLNNSNKAVGYYTIRAGVGNVAPVSDSTIPFAAGALYSTAADMLKWHDALTNYTLLPKEWQEKAYVPFKDRYAYGWFVDTAFGKRLIGHSGGVPGFYTYESRIPEDNVCILLLQNCELPDMDNNTISNQIISSMYNKDFKMPEAKKAIHVNADILQQYAGVYNVMDGFDLTITVKDGHLYAQGTDQDSFMVTAENETKFFSKEVGATIEFKKNDNGKFDKLVLTQNSQEIPAKRKS